MHLARQLTPEDQELEQKRSKLASLEAELAERELEQATLQAELSAFEKRYLRIVGARYAELDEIRARIAEAIAARSPNIKESQDSARRLREIANESAGNTEEENDSQAGKFVPSEELKALYRKIARTLHPDLTTDPIERERRNKLMALVNDAYRNGDKQRLDAILRDYELSPESITGTGTAAELVRVIRKIAQVNARLATIASDILVLKTGELFKLKAKVDAGERDGRDILNQMTWQIVAEIAEARQSLRSIESQKP